jgi:hypothetical protein
MNTVGRLYIVAILWTQLVLLASGQMTGPRTTPLPRGEVKVLPSDPAPTAVPRGGLLMVRYESGRLQIMADDSSLSDILGAIGPLIGSRIDVPAELASERVAVNVISASPQEALGALLGGSRYDYIITGSPEHPDAINHVIIRVRNAAAGQLAAPAIARMPAQQPLAKDFYGEARLPNGLTPQEQVLTREELYQKFVSAQQSQRQEQQGQETEVEISGSKPGRH